MMNYTLYPQLAVFDLELVLLRAAFLCQKMPYRKEEDNIFDANGRLLQTYPEVFKVFETLKNFNIKIGVIESIPPGCQTENIFKIIKWFGWDEYISYTAITTEFIYINFKKVLKDANIPLNKTVLFTLFYGSAYNVQYEDNGFAGLIAGHVTDKYKGMTLEILTNTLKKYKSREQGDPISHDTSQE